MTTKTEGAVDKILEQLEDRVVKTIFLTGEAGVGKTWMAKAVSEAAVKRGSCCETVWIFLDQKHDRDSLYADIARQFSLLISADEWEDYVDIKKEEENSEEDKMEDEILVGLKKIREKHEEKATTSKKYLLWVLDEGNKKERSDLLSVQANGERNEMKKSDCQLLLEEVLGWDYSKVLIARRKSEDTTEGTRVNIIEPLLGKAGITERTRVNTIEPLLGNEASKLLKDRVGKNVSASPGFLELLEAIKGWEKGVLPADVIMISGAINCLAEKEATISEKLKAALNAAVNGLKTLQQRGFTERYYGVFNFEAALNEAAKGQTELQHSGLTKDDVEAGLNAANDLKQLLHCVIEEFSEREEFRANHMIDCFWLSRDFFHKSIGSVHYNELITYWILEGCFDPVDHLEKAYDQGHYVLMKLIDYGMLRMQDDNAIFVEGLTLNIKDERCYGISATANLRLATSMFETEKWEGFGRVALLMV
ncbi:hypothetical protein SLA2020_121200 [Shorea laevis]